MDVGLIKKLLLFALLIGVAYLAVYLFNYLYATAFKTNVSSGSLPKLFFLISLVACIFVYIKNFRPVWFFIIEILIGYLLFYVDLFQNDSYTGQGKVELPVYAKLLVSLFLIVNGLDNLLKNIKDPTYKSTILKVIRLFIYLGLGFLVASVYVNWIEERAQDQQRLPQKYRIGGPLGPPP